MVESSEHPDIWVLNLHLDPHPSWDDMQLVVNALDENGVAYTSYFEDHSGANAYMYYDGTGYSFHYFEDEELFTLEWGQDNDDDFIDNGEDDDFDDEFIDDDDDKEWLLKNGKAVANYTLNDLIQICLKK